MVDTLERTSRIDRHKLGMLLFIASEALFFALLIFTFLYYRDEWIGQPGSGGEFLNVGFAALITVPLLASSLTLWLAEHQLRHGNVNGMRLWLLVTVLLGAVFLIGQGIEYLMLFAEGVTISSGLFGTTFFTLTGFHGFHVFGGLVALALLLALAFAGARGLTGPHSTALETTALYWHFVDVVWIVIFSLVYLWTLLS